MPFRFNKNNTLYFYNLCLFKAPIGFDRSLKNAGWFIANSSEPYSLIIQGNIGYADKSLKLLLASVFRMIRYS